MNRRSALLGVAWICFAAAQAPSKAAAEEALAKAGQSAPSGNDSISTVQEIVVTAQKRVERLVDVPLSVTAASGDQLAKQGITDTAQLTRIVPGFTFQQATYGPPVYAVRGIGFFDNSILAGPTVTTYVDQVPLPLSMMTRGASLDLERVEVLKGPQGTLFGQNSTGGAINYIAAKPTDAPKAGVSLGYGRFNEIAADAFVSGPLSDTLRGRIAVRQESMGGWQQSLTRPGDRLGRERFYNGRLLLDWTPTDKLSFELGASGWIDKSDSLASQFMRFSQAAPVLDPRLQYISNALISAPTGLGSVRAADWNPSTSFSEDNNFYIFSLRSDWDVSESVKLASITSYSRLDVDMPIDTDGTAFDNFSFAAQTATAKTFSQELRLSGEASRIRWMVGGNYQDLNGEEYEKLSTTGTNNSISGFLQNSSAYINNQHTITKGVFGSAEVPITDHLSFQGSVRYTAERRKFNGCLADAGVDPASAPPGYVPIRDIFAGLSFALRGFSGAPPVIPPNGCLTLSDTTLLPETAQRSLHEHNVSWRAGVKWKLGPDAMVYANASKGYKAGSFTILPAIFASQFQPVTQESVMAYETGFKLMLAERAVQLSGASFYYEYSDKQLLGFTNSIIGNLPKLINIPKSRVWGAELEATVRPINGLQISSGITYVNSRVEADPAAPNVALDPFNNPTTYIGESFPNTPRWQGVADAEYGFAVGRNLAAFIGGSATYHSSTSAAFGHAPDFKIPAYTLIDLRAGLRSPDDRWRFQVWGRNVTNKLQVTNISKLIDSLTRTVGMPATYGATLSFRY